MDNKIEQIVEAAIESRKYRKPIASALRTHSITYGELEVLHMIYKSKSLLPSQLASVLYRKPAAISSYLNGLYKNNLVVFSRGIEDRRQVNIEVTGDGISVLRDINNQLT